MSNVANLLEKGNVEEIALLERLDQLVTMMSGDPNGKPDSTMEKPVEETVWERFPFPEEWQDSHLRLLSVRTHNLCAANAVTLFPGWPNQEFNLNLLQRKVQNTYFGISLYDGRIIGHIDTNTAQGLAQIWAIVSKITGVTFDFHRSLSRACNFLEHGNILPHPNDGTVALYGEDCALSLVISYMKHCFNAAQKADKASTEWQKLMKRGMSLLLPMVSLCFSTVTGFASVANL